jgi:pimeloyl-ACP methyl ester carboxylesterase
MLLTSCLPEIRPNNIDEAEVPMRRRLLLAAASLSILLAACDGLHSTDSGQATTGTAPAPQSSQKYTYVLVHGAWAGGWEWKKVGDLLAADGHKVYRPTLTGQGERVHLASPDIDLNTHITDIVNVILFEDLHDIVLMGHSYGGMVITGVVDRVPDRIKCVVYVDAFLPEDGESLNSLGGRGGRGRGTATAPASASAPATAPATRRGGPPPGFSGNPPRPGARPPYDVPQSTKTFSQPVPLKNPDARHIPTVYILTVDKGAQPENDTFYRSYMRAKSYGWETWIMEGDHVVNISHPNEVAALLEKAPLAAKARP